jgi:two-component system response regulator MprA
MAFLSISGRVLLVDDDFAVLSGLRRVFTLEGYEVMTAEDGETALALFSGLAPDLVILDVLLPGLGGLSVCQRIRATSSTPILMLTARDTVPDRVAGLDSGADDYLVKPFATDELLARARALLRRARGAADAEISYADLRLDPLAREAFRSDEPLRLTPREYELLELFLRHPRQALSRAQICQHVWGYAFEGESNFIDVAMKDLRRKLEAEGGSRLIQTVRGYGYALRED